MFRTLSLFFLFLLLCSSAFTQQTWKSVTAERFYLLIHNEHAFLIDCRIPEKYEQDRIEGAFHAADKEQLLALTDTLDKSLPVVVYCDYGDRSETVCEILTNDKGFSDVYNLDEGLDEWKKVGLPIDTTMLKKEENH
mgnify:CR=1 FL=1